MKLYLHIIILHNHRIYESSGNMSPLNAKPCDLDRLDPPASQVPVRPDPRDGGASASPAGRIVHHSQRPRWGHPGGKPSRHPAVRRPFGWRFSGDFGEKVWKRCSEQPGEVNLFQEYLRMSLEIGMIGDLEMDNSSRCRIASTRQASGVRVEFFFLIACDVGIIRLDCR